MARGGAAARSHAPPPERSGATQEGGIPPPAGQRAERAEGRGDGGRGQGARPTRGGETLQHDCGRSAHARSGGEEISARARDARTRWTSGPISERRGAWRPRASHPNKVAPRLWRVERTRGGTQRTLIRKAGAERRPQRVDSQARSGAERAAGLIEEDENPVS